jgi:hypothetical protein
MGISVTLAVRAGPSCGTFLPFYAAVGMLAGLKHRVWRRNRPGTAAGFVGVSWVGLSCCVSHRV